MTLPDSNMSLTCWPGGRAASVAHEIRPGQWGLVLRLDPGDIVITQAPFPTGAVEFARWCRDLSRAAGQVADAVDTTTSAAGETGTAGRRAPRHYVNEQRHERDGGERGW
jgi:hypothetical protein